MAAGNTTRCSGPGCVAIAAAFGAASRMMIYSAPLSSTVLWNNASVNWDAAAFTWN